MFKKKLAKRLVDLAACVVLMVSVSCIAKADRMGNILTKDVV